jgi:transcription elongation GreA/GreB family factor
MVTLDRLPLKTDTKLRINHIAHITVDGDPKTYRIGGYGDGDPGANPPIISYLAPLVSKLIGKEPGAEVRVQLDTKSKLVVLEDIEMPEEPL